MVSNQGYPNFNLGAKESLLALLISPELVHRQNVFLQV